MPPFDHEALVSTLAAAFVMGALFPMPERVFRLYVGGFLLVAFWWTP